MKFLHDLNFVRIAKALIVFVTLVVIAIFLFDINDKA